MARHFNMLPPNILTEQIIGLFFAARKKHIANPVCYLDK